MLTQYQSTAICKHDIMITGTTVKNYACFSGSESYSVECEKIKTAL